MAERRTSVLKSLQGLVTSTRSRAQRRSTDRVDDKSDGKDEKERDGRGETLRTEE